MSIVIATVCLTANLFTCSPMEVRIVDGDTIGIGREKIRILGIDAPELKGACRNEIKMANLAKERLEGLLQHSTVTIDRNGSDRYRRTLATVTADGIDVGEVLMREGLARKWQKKFTPGLDEVWCNAEGATSW